MVISPDFIILDLILSNAKGVVITTGRKYNRMTKTGNETNFIFHYNVPVPFPYTFVSAQTLTPFPSFLHPTWNSCFPKFYYW